MSRLHQYNVKVFDSLADYAGGSESRNIASPLILFALSRQHAEQEAYRTLVQAGAPLTGREVFDAQYH